MNPKFSVGQPVKFRKSGKSIGKTVSAYRVKVIPELSDDPDPDETEIVYRTDEGCLFYSESELEADGPWASELDLRRLRNDQDAAKYHRLIGLLMASHAVPSEPSCSSSYEFRPMDEISMMLREYQPPASGEWKKP